MKSIVAVLAVCVVSVNCQTQSAPVAGPPSSMTKPAAVDNKLKGCRPGCGPTDICVELADNYCRPTQRCSVCAKMSSIRFPTAALSGILNAPGAAPSVPQQQQQMGPGAQYYPQQNVPYRRSQASNMLLPAMMFGGFDGFGLF